VSLSAGKRGIRSQQLPDGASSMVGSAIRTKSCVKRRQRRWVLGVPGLDLGLPPRATCTLPYPVAQTRHPLMHWTRVVPFRTPLAT
jgi:hypothetical protein